MGVYILESELPLGRMGLKLTGAFLKILAWDGLVSSVGLRQSLHLFEPSLPACLLSRFSRVWLYATLRTAACQAPLSVGFSRQEDWCGLSFPPPGHLPSPEMKLGQPALQVDAYRRMHQGRGNDSSSVSACLWWWGSGFSSVQLLICVRLFATPWAAARQASLSITSSRSSPKLMSIESVMPSTRLILCHPLFLLPSVFPSTRVFSSKSGLFQWVSSLQHVAKVLKFQLQHQSFQWALLTEILPPDPGDRVLMKQIHKTWIPKQVHPRDHLFTPEGHMLRPGLGLRGCFSDVLLFPRFPHGLPWGLKRRAFAQGHQPIDKCSIPTLYSGQNQAALSSQPH